MANQSMQNIGGLWVYRPDGEIDAVAKPLAPRPTSLRGARVGILDNHKEFSDVVLGGVADMLKREYGVKEVTYWKKSYLGIGSPFAKEMAAACDVVINGVGH